MPGGSKTLSELTSAAFVEHRGHADSARRDRRAAINRHAKKTIVSAFGLRDGKAKRLNQLHPLQARMPVFADDDVVVHGNAEGRCDIDDRFRHLDIGLRRGRVAGGVIVHEPMPSCITLNTRPIFKRWL
jgi:hypothetical protein